MPNPKIKNWRIRRIQHNLDMEWLQQLEEKYFEKKRQMTARNGEASASAHFANELIKMERHPINKCDETKYAEEMIKTGFPM